MLKIVFFSFSLIQLVHLSGFHSTRLEFEKARKKLPPAQVFDKMGECNLYQSKILRTTVTTTNQFC